MLLSLVSRSLGRARVLLLTLALVLALFEVLLVLAAAYLHETRAFSEIAAFLPVFLQPIVGAAAFTSFGGLSGFGFFHPIVIVALVGSAIVLGSEPAGEVGDGLVNLVMARPVPRRLIVLRTILAFTGGSALVALAMLLANVGAAAAWRPEGATPPSTSMLLRLAGGLLALAWAFGAFTLLIATVARRRGLAAGIAGVVALAMYLLNFLAGILPALGSYGPLSPFHYYQAMAIVMGTDATWLRDVTVLLVASALFSGLSFGAYSRRDL